MRALRHAGLFVLALALWGGSLALGVRTPWEVTVRPVARPGLQGPDTRLVLRAEVTQTFPALEALALGDAGRFDRYGILAPHAGSVHCAWLAPASPALTVTPLGGSVHGGRVHLSLESAAAPGCEHLGERPLLPRIP